MRFERGRFCLQPVAVTDPAALKQFAESRLPASLELLREMVGINSWTLNRDGVNRLGRLTADAFADLGFSAELVPSRNAEFGNHLVLTRPGRTAASVAMISHLDTVFPPEEEVRNDFRWRVDGDRVYGPGTCDIKGGTVMMRLVLESLRNHRPDAFESVGWRLFLNSSEELLSPDFGEVCRARFDPGTLAALVFEAETPLPDGRYLVRSRKGRATWRVTASGRGAHAGVKHAYGANAIVQLGRTVDRIAALTDHSRNLTFNVGSIQGGGGLNRVPYEAAAEGEMRAFDPAVYSAGRAALLALAGRGDVTSVADGHPCNVKVDILHESDPWPVNAATDELLALYQRAGAKLGQRIEGESRGGLSDGNLLWNAVPTLDGLGPAGDNAHCSERSADGSKEPEYCDTASFVPKAMLNVAAIMELIGAA
jgi:glutamate carboxypeptidase